MPTRTSAAATSATAAKTSATTGGTSKKSDESAVASGWFWSDMSKFQKMLFIVAWASLALAVIGGNAISATPVGDFIGDGLVGWWDPLPVVIFWIWGLYMALDLLIDLTPNMPLIWGALFLPSISQGFGGDAGRRMDDWGAGINAWATLKMGDLFGNGTLLTVSLCAVAGSLIIAKKIIQATPADQRAGFGLGVFAKKA